MQKDEFGLLAPEMWLRKPMLIMHPTNVCRMQTKHQT